jgi:dethiobiotin synthetase
MADQLCFSFDVVAMKQTFFITGTDTGVGKTVLGALLTRFLREHGVHAAALKPVCSGGRDDARALHAATGGALALDEINPWHFRAPIAPLLAARKENKRLKRQQVLAHVRAVQKRFDVLVVEGAGGLLSPLGVCGGGLRPSPRALTERRYKESFDSRDLIASLRAMPIIVAPNRLGTVNHVLLTLEALPKLLRAKARIVLFSQPKPDVSAGTNAKLIREISGAKTFLLPWLGQQFLAEKVLKNPRTRRTLQSVMGWPATVD